jgi:phosphatidate phosphatase APP1
MAPFLYEDLTMMLRTIMTRFIKKEVLEAEKLSSQLVKIDVKQKDVHRSYKEVDIGVAAKRAITVSKMSDREILQFRMQCIDFLVAMSSKLMEKSPLRYTLTRAISCLVPQTLQNCRSVSEARMDKLTEILYETQKFFMRHKT